MKGDRMMIKGIVIYYSQTGSTKKIAHAIHNGMNRAEGQCDIARLKDVNPRELTNYDLIGLGSPVIHARELPNVTQFINSMKSLDGKHAFAFCTHGAIPGYYLARVVPAMIQRGGLTVIGWKDWFTAAYHPIIPKPYFTDGHPDAIDIKEAEDFGKEMVERSKKISLGETQLIPTLEKGKEYDERYFPVPDSFAVAGDEFKRMVIQRNFTINEEKCNYPKCTHCMDNCPTQAIELSVSPPVFDKDCDSCFLCEQTCPKGAIEFDYEPLDDSHKPLNVSVLKRSVDSFEEKGLFRRLVPDEDIGWDKSFWRIKKPPRFKIDY
jgi:flavodoxin/ferredoxin